MAISKGDWEKAYREYQGAVPLAACEDLKKAMLARIYAEVRETVFKTRLDAANKAISQGNWPKAIQEYQGVAAIADMETQTDQAAVLQVKHADDAFVGPKTQKERAKDLLARIDAEAQRRLAEAQAMQAQGKFADAIKSYYGISVSFPGRPAAISAGTAANKARSDPKYSLADIESKAKSLDAQIDKLLTGKSGAQRRIEKFKAAPAEDQAEALDLLETLAVQYALTEPGKRANDDLAELRKDSEVYDRAVYNRDKAKRVSKLTLARLYRSSDVAEKAAAVYSQIISDWPRTSEADQAQEELDKLQKELARVKAVNKKQFLAELSK
ncbi:MAG: hypothetical protein HZA50_05550 [Planctomycetes bacterium]|nr:hypothetical protein [Planctomycetota bacterium]